MYADLHAQFHQDVIASFNDYIEIKENPIGNKADIRRGMDAARSLYHFGEFYAKYFKREFRKDVKPFLINQCPDYLTLEAIANVSKHAELNMGKPQVLSSENIYEILVTTYFEDENGRYSHHGKTVQVDLVDGSKRDLDDILVNVLNMWYKILHDNNILENLQYYSLNKNRKVPRNEAKPGNITITVLGEYSFGFDDREYDEETGNIVKLVGKRLVKFGIAHPTTNEELKAEITLNNYEHFCMRQLKSQDEKERYFQGVLRKRGFLATGNNGTTYQFLPS